MVVLVIVIMPLLVIMHKLLDFSELYEMERTQSDFPASVHQNPRVARIPRRGVPVGDHLVVGIGVEMPAVGGDPQRRPSVRVVVTVVKDLGFPFLAAADSDCITFVVEKLVAGRFVEVVRQPDTSLEIAGVHHHFQADVVGPLRNDQEKQPIAGLGANLQVKPFFVLAGVKMQTFPGVLSVEFDAFPEHFRDVLSGAPLRCPLPIPATNLSVYSAYSVVPNPIRRFVHSPSRRSPRPGLPGKGRAPVRRLLPAP